MEKNPESYRDVFVKTQLITAAVQAIYPRIQPYPTAESSAFHCIPSKQQSPETL
jgi:hypothetical protein